MPPCMNASALPHHHLYALKGTQQGPYATPISADTSASTNARLQIDLQMLSAWQGHADTHTESCRRGPPNAALTVSAEYETPVGNLY
jgi:hypothetical protein